MARTLPNILAHGRGRRRAGSATLELALTLGLLLSLTFGTVEFGHCYYVKNTLQGAAREGARASIVASATNTTVTTAVTTTMTAAGFTSDKYTVSIRNSADTADIDVATQTAGTAILVKVSATWGTIGIRPYGLIATGKVIKGTAVMRKEST